MGEREDEQLPVVGEALSHRLGRSFCRVVPRPPGATHDLETCDGARPTIAAEVKELVPGEFLSVQKAVLGDQGLDSNVLSRRWGVIIDEEPLSGRLVPTPPFHDDPPPDEIEKWAAHGFIVTRKSELEQAWQARQSLARRPSILVKNLARDIEPHLAVLEQLGIFETRTWPEPVDREEFLAAIAALGVVAKRTGGAICKAHPPIGDQKPGVDLWFGYSSIRTGDANVVAERVQMWLDSAVSANLRQSLANLDPRPVGV